MTRKEKENLTKAYEYFNYLGDSISKHLPDPEGFYYYNLADNIFRDLLNKEKTR